MVAEAVGFMMSRAADGGTMAPELVTRDFLGGCQAPAPGDDPRHDAAARHDSVMVRTAPPPTLCSAFRLARVRFRFFFFLSRAQLGWTVRALVVN
uniref:Uncharacterized protein n=1 Tax=Aegilops tauschii subsp. strangulata TaxID=200361 RepID=A0A453H1E2_AEGTS